MRVKKWSIVLFLEFCAYAGFYLFGTHGLLAISALKKECALKERTVARLRESNEAVRNELEDWKQYPFYRERFARERLHMAFPTDEVFVF